MFSTPLREAILAFANEPDWATRKQLVERHRDLLLGDEADAVLEAAVARHEQRPEVQRRFALCRTILADCRAIGVDAAFVLSIGPTPGLMEALTDVLRAESDTGLHDTMVRHQALLLMDEADWVLAALAYESPDEAPFVERVAHRRELLGRCRREGIEQAFADMLREDRLTEGLKALVSALGSAKDLAAVLNRYEDVLLTDGAARSVAEMAAKADPRSDVARAFAAMSSLLHIARVDGVSTACVTYSLPPFQQFIKRCFFALTTDEDRDPARRFGIIELLHAEFDTIGSTFSHELHNWSHTVLERATQEELRALVPAVARLGKALQDVQTGDTTLHKQAATACFQSANTFSQRACVLRQKQARKEQAFASVQEAVAAATRMKAEEGFDLFRGQRCDWPVVSSFRRLDAEQQAVAVARANEFIYWAQTEAALGQYAFSSDHAIAVAQHYGIATTFLDFSTDIEVARYFATEHCLDPAYQDAGGQSELSCIVAIRSAHLDAWVEERLRQTDEDSGSQVLRLEVPNLWRIEAQAGVFLIDQEIIDDYPFTYLLFPASLGPEPARARATVYPDKRSDLELILDQWFWHEQASSGTRRVLEMFDRGGVPLHRVMEEPTTGVGLKGIVRPEPHPSWAGREKTWLRATERFDKVLPRPGDTCQVDLRPGLSLDGVRALAATLLPLDSLADRRRRSADWRVLVDGAIDTAAGETLSRQWDALRIDGYSDAQLVASFAASISMLALQLGLMAGWPSYGGSLGITDDITPMTSLFGCDLLVEFTGLVGYSRALVSAVDLQSAVREDVDRYLPTDLYEDCGPTPAERLHKLLVGIHSPILLFDFVRFADIYVRQVVPTSVIFRPKLPLYPVLHLRTFGVP